MLPPLEAFVRRAGMGARTAATEPVGAGSERSGRRALWTAAAASSKALGAGRRQRAGCAHGFPNARPTRVPTRSGPGDLSLSLDLTVRDRVFRFPLGRPGDPTLSLDLTVRDGVFRFPFGRQLGHRIDCRQLLVEHHDETGRALARMLGLGQPRATLLLELLGSGEDPLELAGKLEPRL